MKFPNELNAYCPKCRKKTKHKVRMASKGKARSSANANKGKLRRRAYETVFIKYTSATSQI